MGKTVKTVLTAIIAVVVLLMLATYIYEEFIGIVMYTFTPAVPAAPAKPAIIADIARGETRNLVFGGYTWRVLDVQGDSALLITESIIERRPYHMWERDSHVTWEICTLRTYLNSMFYMGFDVQEQAIIRETENTNAGNPWHGTDGGSVTTDRVFLLSLEEAEQYFQNNSERIANINEQSFWWWLRSPGANPDDAVMIDRDGSIVFAGDHVRATQGMRPALWIEL